MDPRKRFRKHPDVPKPREAIFQTCPTHPPPYIGPKNSAAGTRSPGSPNEGEIPDNKPESCINEGPSKARYLRVKLQCVKSHARFM